MHKLLLRDIINKKEVTKLKDIPVFTTDNGVASLVLKEIPIRNVAYIKILSSATPKLLLDECTDFCKACGAERILFSGIESDEYELAAVIVQMQASDLRESDALLFPATEETIAYWREIYNKRMADVPNAAWMTKADEKKLLVDADCYFVHKNGELIGIGKASGDEVETVVSVVRGSGERVLLALASVLDSNVVKLNVAIENVRAVRLYERLGFTRIREVSRWYKYF